jgi:hypothetical protein
VDYLSKNGVHYSLKSAIFHQQGPLEQGLAVKKLTRANRFPSFAIAKRKRGANFISIKAKLVGINGKMDVPQKYCHP